MAKRYRCRPSELLHMEDAYTAWCLDEACAYILGYLEEGKRPFFERGQTANHTTSNAATIAALQQLGAEVIHIGS